MDKNKIEVLELNIVDVQQVTKEIAKERKVIQAREESIAKGIYTSIISINKTLESLRVSIVNLTDTLENIIKTLRAAFDAMFGKDVTQDGLRPEESTNFIKETIIAIGASIASAIAAVGVEAYLVPALAAAGLSGGWIAAIIAALVLVVAIAVATIVDDWENICGLFSGIGDMIGGIFSGDYQQAENGLNNALKSYLSSDYMPYNIITAIAMLFGVDVEEEMAKAVEFLENGGSILDPITTGVGTFLKDLIGQIADAVDEVKRIMNEIWSGEDGLGEKVKSGINKAIEFINKFLLFLPSRINSLIEDLNNFRIDIPSWVPIYGGKSIGFSLDFLRIPQIPLLAKGAVLPANKPFLAMVGDQRHGTNIEAPLATIQEAVALVMEDYANRNAAGQQATVAVLRNILEAVLGIQIGDDVIGRAAIRYNRKMAIARGGY